MLRKSETPMLHWNRFTWKQGQPSETQCLLLQKKSYRHSKTHFLNILLDITPLTVASFHWDCVKCLDEHFAVCGVGCRVQDRQRQPILVYHKMALHSRFAAIRWVRPYGLPPFGAATCAGSTLARSHLLRSASSSLVSSVSYRFCQTPA